MTNFIYGLALAAIVVETAAFNIWAHKQAKLETIRRDGLTPEERREEEYEDWLKHQAW
jgi:hypothetical protein